MFYSCTRQLCPTTHILPYLLQCGHIQASITQMNQAATDADHFLEAWELLTWTSKLYQDVNTSAGTCRWYMPPARERGQRATKTHRNKQESCHERAGLPSCHTCQHGPGCHSLPESCDARSRSSSASWCSRPYRSTTPAFGIWLPVPNPPNPSPSLHRSLDLEDRDTPAVAAATRREERKKTSESKSSSSGYVATSQGSDTSPPASSLFSTQANLPELFALLAMQRKAGQGKRQCDDSEDRTKRSVSRRRGDPPTTTATSGRTTKAKRVTRLHQSPWAAASCFRTRKCSWLSLSKPSLEGGRTFDERMLEPKDVADSTVVVVRRKREEFAFVMEPGRMLSDSCCVPGPPCVRPSAMPW
ncbi:hypothetical protein HPB51_010006 [Rhipicephalus microplus]|uniref:Uncharacterized protein n=1 Tax=Rhipicephalus microplus TaxID=6941 RepID=A0A9J6ESG5_RHIMP|nr:hypothetical protein HPB51_010006 [Rhipicephalus microplus]